MLIHTVAVLACARLTRLVTTDTITAPLRARLELLASRVGTRYGWVLLHELVTCPWCNGYWIGLAGSGAALAICPFADVGPWVALVPVSLAYSLLIVTVLGVAERAASLGRG